MISFGLISACGNFLVIITVCCSQSLRTVTNYFVVSLAFANFCITTLLMPLTLRWSIEGARVDSNHWACDFQATLIVSLVFLAVINIALMAVNRYVRVCRSQNYPRIFSKKNAIILITASWVLTFGLSTALLQGSGLAFSQFIPSLLVCLFVYEGRYSLVAILGNMAFLICVGVPLTIMFVCYYKVFRKIREHRRNVGPSAGASGVGLGPSVREVKITWTLFAVLLSYLLSWIPAFVIMLTNNFIISLPRSVLLVVTYTVLFSSCINPFIYGITNNAFRNEYARILKLKCRRNNVDS